MEHKEIQQHDRIYLSVCLSILLSIYLFIGIVPQKKKACHYCYLPSPCWGLTYVNALSSYDPRVLDIIISRARQNVDLSLPRSATAATLSPANMARNAGRSPQLQLCLMCVCINHPVSGVNQSKVPVTAQSPLLPPVHQDDCHKHMQKLIRCAYGLNYHHHDCGPPLPLWPTCSSEHWAASNWGMEKAIRCSIIIFFSVN